MDKKLIMKKLVDISGRVGYLEGLALGFSLGNENIEPSIAQELILCGGSETMGCIDFIFDELED